MRDVIRVLGGVLVACLLWLVVVGVATAGPPCCCGPNCQPPAVPTVATPTQATLTVPAAQYHYAPVYRTNWRGVVIFCGYAWVPAK